LWNAKRRTIDWPAYALRSATKFRQPSAEWSPHHASSPAMGPYDPGLTVVSSVKVWPPSVLTFTFQPSTHGVPRARSPPSVRYLAQKDSVGAVAVVRSIVRESAWAIAKLWLTE